MPCNASPSTVPPIRLPAYPQRVLRLFPHDGEASICLLHGQERDLAGPGHKGLKHGVYCTYQGLVARSGSQHPHPPGQSVTARVGILLDHTGLAQGLQHPADLTALTADDAGQVTHRAVNTSTRVVTVEGKQ